MSSGTSDRPFCEIERLRVVSNAAGIALWSWHADGAAPELNGRARRLWGVADTGPIRFDDLAACVVPEDLDRVRATFVPARAAAGEFEIGFRVVRDGEVRWLSGRGSNGTGLVDAGLVGAQVAFSIFFDVTEHERMEQRRQMLAAEMDHRVKNSFAIASALTSLTARTALTTDEMAQDLQGRFAALCLAHDLVRLPGQSTPHARLGDLIAVLLSAYDGSLDGCARIRLRMPDVLVGATAATTLALVFHELGTNSVKYGALSTPGGRLDVAASLDGLDVVIVWTERGGPPATTPPKGTGFGTSLIQQSVAGQLDGSACFAWQTRGLGVTVRVSGSRLSR